MKDKAKNSFKFNLFSFISTFARALIEIFISLYLFKEGFSIKDIILFYILEHFFAIFLSYIYVKVGEKYNYSLVMTFGIVSFIILQILLITVYHSMIYLIIISLLFSLYRRGYWISRRFYMTNIVSSRNSTDSYSFIVLFSELASILSGYVGAILLDKYDIKIVIIISSILLMISILPITKIKTNGNKTKLELIKNLKKYDKRNYVAFSLYEINNVISFLFPVFIAIYINNSYTMAGNVNAISNIALIIFIFIYGKLIKKKNHFIISTYLFIIITLSKLFIFNYFILAIYFIEGLVLKMQNQSLNKIYFENRKGMDITHYNLIYQELECVARALVAIPLLFMNDIRVMIMFVTLVIFIELLIYKKMKLNSKLS